LLRHGRGRYSREYVWIFSFLWGSKRLYSRVSIFAPVVPQALAMKKFARGTLERTTCVEVLVMCSNSDYRSRTRRCHLCPPTSCTFAAHRLSKACPTARRSA
jgi:hypothetical protein